MAHYDVKDMCDIASMCHLSHASDMPPLSFIGLTAGVPVIPSFDRAAGCASAETSSSRVTRATRERLVFFSVKVRELLKEFLAIRGVDDEPLFHFTSSGILTTLAVVVERI